MFLENKNARPLFDFTEGGPPKAYKCLTPECGRVTRTERGMKMHLRKVHGWEEQPCLYSTDNQKPVNGEPRKLRAGPPVLNQGEPNHMEKTLSNQKSLEMKEKG